MSIVGLNLGRISCHWVFTNSNFIFSGHLLNSALQYALSWWCWRCMKYRITNGKDMRRIYQKMKESPLPFFCIRMKKAFLRWNSYDVIYGFHMWCTAFDFWDSQDSRITQCGTIERLDTYFEWKQSNNWMTRSQTHR